MTVERIYYDKIQELEKENKQLKDLAMENLTTITLMHTEYDKLKEIIEKIKKLSFHAGCNGNPSCVL